MKLFQKKNNKGFSLVELIVVVAIMAVLMGILIPTLIKNVEKSKRQKDLSGIEEIRSAMVTELASEKYSAVSGTLTYNNGVVDIDAPTDGLTGFTNANQASFLALVADDVKDYTLASGAYKTLTVTFVFDGKGGVTANIAGVNIANIDYSVSTLQTQAAPAQTPAQTQSN